MVGPADSLPVVAAEAILRPRDRVRGRLEGGILVGGVSSASMSSSPSSRVGAKFLAAAVAPLDDEDAAEAAFLPFRLLLALDMAGVSADAEAADLADASLLPRVLLGLCLLAAEALSPAPPSASPASSSIASSSFMIASSSSR